MLSDSPVKIHFTNLILTQFVAGATVPEGQTNFELSTAYFHFKSTVYEWLVVSGSTKAKFKGVGTINGGGSYQFMVTVIDSGGKQ